MNREDLELVFISKNCDGEGGTGRKSGGDGGSDWCALNVHVAFTLCFLLTLLPFRGHIAFYLGCVSEQRSYRTNVCM